MRQLSNRHLWFIHHIGKRIYRNSNGCNCSVCESVLKNGLLIEDSFHADYLHDCEGDSQVDGLDLRYFETKEEAQEYEYAKKLGTSRNVTPR